MAIWYPSLEWHNQEVASSVKLNQMISNTQYVKDAATLQRYTLSRGIEVETTGPISLSTYPLLLKCGSYTLNAGGTSVSVPDYLSSIPGGEYWENLRDCPFNSNGNAIPEATTNPYSLTLNWGGATIEIEPYFFKKDWMKYIHVFGQIRCYPDGYLGGVGHLAVSNIEIWLSSEIQNWS